jgi:hypothetical protein
MSTSSPAYKIFYCFGIACPRLIRDYRRASCAQMAEYLFLKHGLSPPMVVPKKRINFK